MPKPQQEMLEDLEQILELLELGFTERAIRKKLQLDHRAFARRMKLVRKRVDLKSQAITYCLETVLRLQKLRQINMALFQKYESTKQATAAVGALRNVFNIDVQIPETCALLGFIPNPEIKVRHTYDDPKLSELGPEELFAHYDSFKSNPGVH